MLAIVLVFHVMSNLHFNGDVCFILDQHALLNFYRASSLKQQFICRHVTPLGHIILTEQTSLCPYSFMLHA